VNTAETNDDTGIEEPPTTFLGTLRRVGPGIIIAAGIVGSGELIATTKTGAQAGITLLWIILIGCLIKVFVQIEIGRYAVTHGETTLRALNGIPGPFYRVRWIIWYWLLMMIVLLGQSGGIVGGVGQAISMVLPITGDYAAAIQLPSTQEVRGYCIWRDRSEENRTDSSSHSEQQRIDRGYKNLEARLHKLGERGSELLAGVRGVMAAENKFAEIQANGTAEQIAEAEKQLAVARSQIAEPYTLDDRIWAVLAGLFTITLLVRGRFRLIQTLATTLVVVFTVVTLGNVLSLQMKPQFALTVGECLEGLSFQIPAAGLATALATFGIIGVGGSELISYPYWCLEKGYAKFTGPRTDDESWERRARGWMKVMRLDAFLSMVIYTIATLAFFMMGVSVLHREGLDPNGMRMVSTLMEQYVPVFGNYAQWLFLLGAVAVLYSTYLIAHAAFSRLYTDALKVFGFVDPNDRKTHERLISIFSCVTPMISVGIYCLPGANPVALVLLGGSMQALILPMLAFAALYFRYRKTDPRLRPSVLWDAMLVLSCLGLLVAGGGILYVRLSPYFMN